MKRATILVVLALAAVSLATAQTKKTAKAGSAAKTVSLAAEKVGGEPKAFLPMVGDWSIVSDDGEKVLMVDGRKWKAGQPAGGLADKARAIYGSKHEDFIDNVKAFAYYPYAVAHDVDDFQNGDISLRFKLLAGQLDQCAGILFNLKPNGDYLTVRFNDKEDNLVLWMFKNGKRSFVKRGKEDMPLPMKQWESMKIVVNGQKLEGYLNGKLLLEYDLPEPVNGKVGVWSKTDSVAEFADFTVAKK